jgi:hypothetical protein
VPDFVSTRSGRFASAYAAIFERLSSGTSQRMVPKLDRTAA